MTTHSSKYRLLEKFRSVFEGVAYRHRASTTGDSVAIELHEDLYDLGKSPKLTNRIDNKISAYLLEQLVNELHRQGIEKVDHIKGGCCSIKIELLQVSTRRAVIKKPGIDLSANIIVRDAGDRMIYSRGYAGQSGTLMNTWWHLIDHACEDVSKKIAADEDLLNILRTGKISGQ